MSDEIKAAAKKPRFLPALHNPTAVFSPCQTWRYVLARTWNPDLPRLLVIGLNPSVASETQDDNTIRRCIGFARDWGYGTYTMCNAFGLRSTDPAGLLAVSDPNGLENDQYIYEQSRLAAMVLVAWGAHKLMKKRARHVLKLLDKQPYCLGTTKKGFPKHPLYVIGTRKPEPYPWPLRE